jgi:NADPH:quinone reductase-like Zn-dependent oxidoreductase
VSCGIAIYDEISGADSIEAMTSALGLFVNLALPTPLLPAKESIPLLIYGASSAVGAYAIKLAKLANIHPIIGVAGSGGDFAKSIGCDVIVDHRKGQVVEDIKKALSEHAPGRKLLHVYDAISEQPSGEHVNAVADQGATVTHVLMNTKDYDSEKFTVIRTMVGDSHGEDASRRDFAYAYYRLFGKWMKEGRFAPHPYEVVPGGLEAVVGGLMRLKEGKVSAKKLIFKVADA